MTPTDLINLAIEHFDGHIQRSATPETDATVPKGSLKVAQQLPIGSVAGWPAFNVTQDQRISMILRAASIMWAESKGDPLAVCYNVTDAAGRTTCSKTGPAGPKGRDRGLWQFNERAHPDVSDQVAFDPDQSTEIAWLKSSAFRSFGPWSKSKGMNPNSPESQQVKAAYESMLGRAVDDTPILSAIDPNADLSFGGIGDWLGQLGKLLSFVTSQAFWRRAGIAGLGLLLLLVAVALTVGGSKLAT